MVKLHLQYILFALVLLFGGAAGAQTGIITTVAGNGFSVGDGGAASAATICNPLGVATDRLGNVYVADICDNRVRKISTAGIISTVAGNGIGGFGGDGGPATDAKLDWPYGVVVDSAGNIFIADEENYRVRKVDAFGIITTIAGNGTWGYSGDGGPATAAQLFYPTGVAVDAAGSVYIADLANNAIRKVTSGIITTFAGTGTPSYTGDGGAASSATLYMPIAITIDVSGNLYIADYWNNAVRKVSGGIITTVAGNGMAASSGDGGPATAASIYNPTGVALNAAGSLFISDNQYNIVRVVSPTTHIINLFAGNTIPGFMGDGGPATAAELNSQYGLATDATGNVYIADGSNNRIRVVNTAGIISSFAGTGTGGSYYGLGSFGGDYGPAVLAYLNNPKGVSVDHSENIYIADQFNNRIRFVKYPADLIMTVAGNGVSGYSGDGGPADSAELNLPCGVCAKGSDYYIADMRNNVIRKVTLGVIHTIAGTGVAGYSGDGGPAVSAHLNSPTDVAVDGLGNVFIADRSNNLVRRVDPLGTITTVAGNGTAGYTGDGGPANAAELFSPTGIAVDGFGNLYIADLTNNCIRKVNAAGMIATIAGTGAAGYSGDGGPATAGQLFGPTGVAVDSRGNLYVSDAGNFKIRKIDTFGIITSICGDGIDGYHGDGGLADTAEVYNTFGIALDDSANVYIADTHNQRIRKIENATPPLETGLLNGTEPFEIEISPNPAQGDITVTVTAGSNELETVVITDVTGGVVKTLSFSTNVQEHIHLNVPSGMYFITASAPDFNIYSKFLVIN